MRLINTANLQLEEHNDLQLPSGGYAILSHRWRNAWEEVTFQDLESGRDISRKKGYPKVKSFCDLAYDLGYKYAWLDTCCINKDSATELLTALNSMYRWYAESRVCIAYLEDVYRNDGQFGHSEWFKRGWTLQELIAPVHMIFYDQKWRRLGTKLELLRDLVNITGVQKAILSNTAKPTTCSIAQRMSWAAGRTTTRVEDRAYSLLGLFDVTLEMVSGEQEKAFLRLQEKIIGQSADQSIFTWSLHHSYHPLGYSGMFAPSPDSFKRCGAIVSTSKATAFFPLNTGLAISLKTLPYSMNTYMALLDCAVADNSDLRIAILLAELPGHDQWARIVNSEGDSVIVRHSTLPQGEVGKLRKMNIRQTPEDEPLQLNRLYGFRLRSIEAPHRSSKIRILPRVATERKEYATLEPGTNGTAVIISIQPSDAPSTYQLRWIKIGLDHDFFPIIMVANEAGRRNIFSRRSRDFKRALTARMHPYSREEMFNTSWDVSGFREHADYSNPQLLYPKWVGRGYYAWRVSRGPGDFDFAELNLKVRVSFLQDEHCPLDSSRRAHSPPYAWTIDILPLNGRVTHERSPADNSTWASIGVMGAAVTGYFGYLVWDEMKDLRAR